MSDDEINSKYESGSDRIIIESNREQLPNFVEALRRPNYIQLRPFYQRRLRWDRPRQSRLIESFIINVPIPPIFLYEKSYGSYEVMDGQQRITAIEEFYNNNLRLTGLERWPELNGRTYGTLPLKIKSGIDRRSISSIVLLKESARTEEEAMLLKQLVFERLNTGGVRLGKQEIRNALYQSRFNALLLELSRTPIFAVAWGLPLPSKDEDIHPPAVLIENPKFRKMEDAEIVLRFFALRHIEHYSGGMQNFLDRYMIRSLGFNDFDIDFLRKTFEATIRLAHSVYGGLLFRPYDPEKDDWAKHAHKAFYDAVMVAMSRHLDKANEIHARGPQIQHATMELFKSHPKGTFTGRANTKADILARIDAFEEMLTSIVGS